MNISEENIEAYLLQYAEHTLSEEEVRSVESYLRLHPEWNAVWTAYNPDFRMPETPLPDFPRKAALRKKPALPLYWESYAAVAAALLLFCLAWSVLHVALKKDTADWANNGPGSTPPPAQQPHLPPAPDSVRTDEDTRMPENARPPRPKTAAELTPQTVSIPVNPENPASVKPLSAENENLWAYVREEATDKPSEKTALEDSVITVYLNIFTDSLVVFASATETETDRQKTYSRLLDWAGKHLLPYLPEEQSEALTEKILAGAAAVKKIRHKVEPVYNTLLSHLAYE